MRKMMKEGETAYRAVAQWRDTLSGDVVKTTIVGPYSKPGTASGSLTQELNRWCLGENYKKVKSGEYTFDRWVEEANTEWKRLP